ncbi:MAG TPA: substrate-binding domain-containing protein [Tepidisphaeraceae bacterium]|nr:substrate-binding domain-containing protein [Tepidisphaeraceae bacterium]
MRITIWMWAVIGLACIGLAFSGCKKEDSGAGAGGKRTVVIGMVAKSQANDVFQAAYAGAKDAAKELGEKHGVEVEIDWRTPTTEDAAKQVEAIEALTRAGVDAITVSCTDAATLTPAIDRATEKGVPVMCFDSDAPSSKRMAYYGSDNRQIGQVIIASLAKVMDEKGTVAILGGNQSATNLAARVQAAKDELAKHPDMKLLPASGGVFYHEETPEKAAEAVATATNANPSIEGWAFIGGWPLFTTNALKWEPGQIKVVSCDALPAQLAYLRSGHVQALFAQDCYGWGYKSVEVLLDKVVNQKEPADPIMVDPLTEVTKANVDEYAKNWDKWLGK